MESTKLKGAIFVWTETQFTKSVEAWTIYWPGDVPLTVKLNWPPPGDASGNVKVAEPEPDDDVEPTVPEISGDNELRWPELS